jgi:hypothetical protein
MICVAVAALPHVSVAVQVRVLVNGVAHVAAAGSESTLDGVTVNNVLPLHVSVAVTTGASGMPVIQLTVTFWGGAVNVKVGPVRSLILKGCVHVLEMEPSLAAMLY